ncbi:unnamed protein product [Caenorhabditis brenneri]
MTDRHPNDGQNPKKDQGDVDQGDDQMDGEQSPKGSDEGLGAEPPQEGYGAGALPAAQAVPAQAAPPVRRELNYEGFVYAIGWRRRELLQQADVERGVGGAVQQEVQEELLQAAEQDVPSPEQEEAQKALYEAAKTMAHKELMEKAKKEITDRVKLVVGQAPQQETDVEAGQEFNTYENRQIEQRQRARTMDDTQRFLEVRELARARAELLKQKKKAAEAAEQQEQECIDDRDIQSTSGQSSSVQPSSAQPSSKQSSSGQPPSAQSSSEQSPSEQSPSEQSPSEQSPSQQSPSEQSSSEQSSSEQSSSAQSSSMQEPSLPSYFISDEEGRELERRSILFNRERFEQLNREMENMSISNHRHREPAHFPIRQRMERHCRCARRPGRGKEIPFASFVSYDEYNPEPVRALSPIMEETSSASSSPDTQAASSPEQQPGSSPEQQPASSSDQQAVKKRKEETDSGEVVAVPTSSSADEPAERKKAFSSSTAPSPSTSSSQSGTRDQQGHQHSSEAGNSEAQKSRTQQKKNDDDDKHDTSES